MPSSSAQSVTVDLPLSLRKALDEEAARVGQSTSLLILSLLADHLRMKIHTVFQVSTSGDVVADVYDKEVTVGTLLEHGDLGLGTFAGLNDGMIVVGGRAHRILGSGQVSLAHLDAGASFAIVTDFAPDQKGGSRRARPDDPHGRRHSASSEAGLRHCGAGDHRRASRLQRQCRTLRAGLG